ncbi:3'-5' exonuclease [Polynucleobacter tropicus]|uniref:3'-5' exonuclease n=1 Tax=Polynucleobacter tropicus TaxID=1743174 RepID=A0A6M9PXZ9_9BURK|nr:3'-5' exonuclease [Polynucleobacter tropicus]QKM65131.1 3'-5' exonuclease [Polynucleobacter tropicus]
MSQLLPGFIQKLYRSVWREWLIFHLGDERYKFMFDKPPANEWVVIDCETTGLNIAKDQVISIGAVKIVGNKIMTSERLEILVKPDKEVSAESVKIHRLRELDVANGLDPEIAVAKLMQFIGSRPIVGYYLEFDLGMLHKVIWPMLGQGLPQEKIEVSEMYYEYKNSKLPPNQRGQMIDLRFDTLMKDLGLPTRDAHDAMNDAVMTGMAFIKLRELLRK